MGFNTTYATCFFRSESEAQGALEAFELLNNNREESFIKSLRNQNKKTTDIISKFDSYRLEKIEIDDSNLFIEIDFNSIEENDYVVEYLRAISTAFAFTKIFSITFDDNDGSNHIHLATKDELKCVYNTGSGNRIDKSINEIEWKEPKELLSRLYDMYNSNIFSEESINQANLSPEKKQNIESSCFKIGDNVEHYEFGKGVIVDIEDEGSQYCRVEVKFSNDEKKWLMMSYAKLKII